LISEPHVKTTYARVIIDRAIHRELDYEIPESFADRVNIGWRVRVPFRDHSALATVVAVLDETGVSGIGRSKQSWASARR
jgi:primosomal protein N'